MALVKWGRSLKHKSSENQVAAEYSVGITNRKHSTMNNETFGRATRLGLSAGFLLVGLGLIISSPFVGASHITENFFGNLSGEDQCTPENVDALGSHGSWMGLRNLVLGVVCLGVAGHIFTKQIE